MEWTWSPYGMNMDSIWNGHGLHIQSIWNNLGRVKYWLCSSRLGCLTWPLPSQHPFPLCRMPQTCPCGHVFGVWHIPLMSNTTNVPTEAHLWSSTHSLPFRSCWTPQMSLQGCVFSVRCLPHSFPPSKTLKTCPQGHIFGVQRLPKSPTLLFPLFCTFYFWYLPF